MLSPLIAAVGSRKLWSVALLRTAWARLAGRNPTITIFRKHRFSVARDSIRGRGALQLGKTWYTYPVLPGFFFIETGGTCSVNGQFQIHEGCRTEVKAGGHLELGSGYINAGGRVICEHQITIGDYVLIGEQVTIMDSDQHRLSGSGAISAPISIENHVWIGANVTILKGVSIGRGSVIAAGSLVTRDVPPGKLAAGVPARVLRPVTWE